MSNDWTVAAAKEIAKGMSNHGKALESGMQSLAEALKELAAAINANPEPKVGLVPQGYCSACTHPISWHISDATGEPIPCVAPRGGNPGYEIFCDCETFR